MSQKLKYLLFGLLLVTVVALSFGTGFNLGSQTQSVDGEGLGIMVQAWNFLFEDYVDRDRLDDSALSQAAIKGMLEELDDPYTSYLDIETYQLGLSGLQGEMEGIGAQVAIRDEKLTVIAPIADSPAAGAGVRAGDVILEVDGSPTTDMSLAEAVLNIRGPKGTRVRLLILHQDETEPEEIEIIRAKIELTSIHFEMMEGIAYINITYFSGRTDEELSPVLESLAEEGAEGIILDLRHNPGGILDEVVKVVSHFVPEGMVLNVVDNQGGRTAMEVRPGVVTTDLPVVVLVDEFSASGSEVLSGALQDHGRATIAGRQTFGKGSVNILRRLDDGSGLYITTARWLTPEGRPIEREGIKPDHELEFEGEEAIQWAIDYLKGSK
ncbi:MAG: S41 family peptidase [Dehalococcoidales bacterium]|jgi:carboxyl-terminal processing protease|nr:S41 family peptidase [Dehalococcoidales bacterium]MDP7415488.1 S41 family peptidase [Dehalococcoidales bacterium]